MNSKTLLHWKCNASLPGLFYLLRNTKQDHPIPLIIFDNVVTRSSYDERFHQPNYWPTSSGDELMNKPCAQPTPQQTWRRKWPTKSEITATTQVGTSGLLAVWFGLGRAFTICGPIAWQITGSVRPLKVVVSTSTGSDHQIGCACVWADAFHFTDNEPDLCPRRKSNVGFCAPWKIKRKLLYLMSFIHFTIKSIYLRQHLELIFKRRQDPSRVK